MEIARGCQREASRAIGYVPVALTKSRWMEPRGESIDTGAIFVAVPMAAPTTEANAVGLMGAVVVIVAAAVGVTSAAAADVVGETESGDVDGERFADEVVIVADGNVVPVAGHDPAVVGAMILIETDGIAAD